ncbi:MFS transporter [Roseiterribacter gracilis]|uniref:MFS transporter n=1 Tax=Roseiterribacter gracilis TaxID=2812848 RepID=A0A8S8XCH4_9PROT|nr:MFS transporter [Rhodospirillales bacterium TMPK1]
MTSTTADTSHAAIPSWITLLLASACGVIVANIYYAQPLVGPIAASLGISAHGAGIVVTMTQIGYALGLLLVVPLADLIENRRLVLVLTLLAALALTGAALATDATVFLFTALLIGLGSVAVQVLVPYAAHLASDATRGRMVGKVMSGLLLGIMLARPVSSFLTDLFSWRAVFVVSAIVMLIETVVLARALPPRQPDSSLRYGALLRSMITLVVTTKVLRRRALIHACLFGAFSVFWTAAPLLLASPAFGLSQTGIALFALTGAAGAIAAPLAGRWGDKGLSQRLTPVAIVLVALAFLLSKVGAEGSTLSLAALTVAGVVLDFGLVSNLVFSQRAIYAINPAARGRLNGVFMATFFAGGAIGSALGAWAYVQGGWALASWIGFAAPVCALLYFSSEALRPSR